MLKHNFNHASIDIKIVLEEEEEEENTRARTK